MNMKKIIAKYKMKIIIAAVIVVLIILLFFIGTLSGGKDISYIPV